MAKHLHRASKYVPTGNIGAMELICKCGHRVHIRSWYLTLDSDWCPDHWRLHGLRKAMATYERFEKLRRKLARHSVRKLDLRAAKAGRTPDEQERFEDAQYWAESRKFWAENMECNS